jgi:hypothetical protein
MTMQDVLDGRWIDVKTAFQSFTLDLIVPHLWVLTGDADNQCFKVCFEPWSSSAVRLPARPLASDAIPMPFEDGVGLDEQHGFEYTLLPLPRLQLQTGQQGNEHQLLGTRQTWFRLCLALQQWSCGRSRAIWRPFSSAASRRDANTSKRSEATHSRKWSIIGGEIKPQKSDNQKEAYHDFLLIQGLFPVTDEVFPRYRFQDYLKQILQETQRAQVA